MIAFLLRLASTVLALACVSGSALAVTAAYVNGTRYGDGGIPSEIRAYGDPRYGIHVIIGAPGISISMSGQLAPLPDVFPCYLVGFESCPPRPSGPLAARYDAHAAEKFGQNSGWHAGLNVNVNGTECDEVRGDFYIYELTLAANGQVESLHFSLTQQCYGSPHQVAISGAVNASGYFGLKPRGYSAASLFMRQDYFVPRGEPARNVTILAAPDGDMQLPSAIQVYVGNSRGVDVPMGADGTVTADFDVDSSKDAVRLQATSLPIGQRPYYGYVSAVAHIFDPHEVVFEHHRQTINVQVGDGFDIYAALSIRQLYASNVAVTIDAPVAGPGVAEIPASQTTDWRGRVGWRLRANDTPGAYVVTLRYAGARFDVNVVNHPRPSSFIRYRHLGVDERTGLPYEAATLVPGPLAAVSASTNRAGGASITWGTGCFSRDCPEHITRVEFGVKLAPAAGQSFGAGTYVDATAFSETPGTRPGLSAGYVLSALPCAPSSGHFVVLEDVRAANGTILAFAADFEEHCGGTRPSMKGGVRFNSAIPYSDTAPGPVPAPTVPAPLRESTLSSPAGQLHIAVTQAKAATCALTSAALAPRPEGLGGVVVPYPTTTMSVSDCGVGGPVTFSIDFPADLPPTATYWKFGPTSGHSEPRWYPLPSRVDGKRITFTIVDGGAGDDDLLANGSILQTGAVAFAGGVYQDLWWSGPAENGWGMSVVQHRDTLFANIYAYDAQGEPTWYVMPSGAWNEARTTFTAPVYLPKGSAYFAYDASRFDAGAPVGTATLTFYAMNDAALEYTIDGVKGRKIISRVEFGSPAEEASRNVSDLWWGGAGQNGWGVALMQQHSALFALWFTYDAAGKPRWFVMPAGDWNGADIYQGALFRATGSPWLEAPYDASKHRMNEAGSYRFRFSGDAATFDYSVDGRVGSLPLSRIPF